MINSNTVQLATQRYRILTDDQIEEIKWAAFEVLSKVGVSVRHPEALKMLKQAGAKVKDNLVKVPEHIVLGCLATTPKGWTIYDRLGNRAMEVQGRKSYFGTSTASPNTIDALTGEHHPTLLEDIARGAKVADACEHISFVMPFGSSQDVPANAIDLWEFPVVTANTSKPVVGINYSGRGTELMIEMAAAVVGGLENLQEKPYVIVYPEPITPLVQPAEVVDRIFAAADYMIPQVPGPSIQMGSTGPATVPGAVTLGLAEGLMCLVLAQLRKPGCPVSLSTNQGCPDMATGLSVLAMPTKSQSLIAHAEVAQSLGLPTWGLAGATDSKCLDTQAGIDATFHALLQALGGLNMIHDVGYMESGMACSCAQLVVGNEIIGQVKHFLKGFEFSRQSLAREVIAAVGPGGQFLTQRHTLENFRQTLYRPRLMNYQPRGAWVESGSKDMAARAYERVAEILATHQPAPLPEGALAEMERIRDRGTKELCG